MLTYVVCRASYRILDINPEAYVGSEWYVPTPSVVAASTGLMCWVFALPFILLIGHVSDTILFCFALEKRRLWMPALPLEQGMLAGLSCCAQREEHKVGSTLSQPPETHSLLEKATLDHESSACSVM